MGHLACALARILFQNFDSPYHDDSGGVFRFWELSRSRTAVKFLRTSPVVSGFTRPDVFSPELRTSVFSFERQRQGDRVQLSHLESREFLVVILADDPFFYQMRTRITCLKKS